MPKNDTFSFEVLVGDSPTREYEKDGNTYIVTDLMHETTYYEQLVEVIDGVEERQRIPVTPYQISITLSSMAKSNEAWASVLVDGSPGNVSVFVRKGQSSIVKGFVDGDKTREFLFSLPRFGRDKDDHIEQSRISSIGVIEVVLQEAKFVKTTFQGKANKKAKLNYMQATKKDAKEVTQGNHTMATTRPGRCLEDMDGTSKKRKFGKMDTSERVNIYDKGKEMARLKLKYHMKHTLENMGINVE